MRVGDCIRVSGLRSRTHFLLFMQRIFSWFLVQLRILLKNGALALAEAISHSVFFIFYNFYNNWQYRRRATDNEAKIHRLSFVLVAADLFLIPAGISFLFLIRTVTIYIISAISFCGIYIATTSFSIFAVYVIQQGTPTHLTGKPWRIQQPLPYVCSPWGKLYTACFWTAFAVPFILYLSPQAFLFPRSGC